MFPNLPSWDSIHPLIVHFPIALILVAPIFVIASMVFRKSAFPLGACALILMAMGTVGAILAVATGEAGAELAERVPGVEVTLEKHEDLAETTRTMLIVVTVVYALIVAAPLAMKKLMDPVPSTLLNVSFLVLYLVGASFLINTAHQGGLLVHAYGVHAMLGPSTPQDASSEVAENDQAREEDEEAGER